MPPTIIADLNSLSSNSVLVVLLEIDIPSTPAVRICSNNEDVVFGGEIYQPFPFQLSELTTAGKGEVPEWQIQIDNTTRAMDVYLQAYDIYLKTHGHSGNKIACTCHVVSTLDLTQAIMTEYFELESWESDTQWVSFKLGASSPFTMRYPRRRILQNFCGWKYRSTQCSYSGSLTTCDKTLGQCRARGNSSRFGGFPGISKGVRL